nr:ATP synthase F0 subunit 8 [Micranisa ralianga]
MPQMSPMLWILLFNYFLLIMIMSMIMIYFLFIPKNLHFIENKHSLQLKVHKIKW